MEQSGFHTNTPDAPEGCLRRRPHTARLVGHVESRRAVGGHMSSPARGDHSPLAHRSRNVVLVLAMDIPVAHSLVGRIPEIGRRAVLLVVVGGNRRRMEVGNYNLEDTDCKGRTLYRRLSIEVNCVFLVRRTW